MRAARRASDQRAKARARRILALRGNADPSPAVVGIEANRHNAQDRHRWCGCQPRYWKGDVKPRDRA